MKANLCYDPVQDKIIEIHSTVRTVIVRELTRKLNQIIYYEFEKPIDKHLFFCIVKKVKQTDFRIRTF